MVIAAVKMMAAAPAPFHRLDSLIAAQPQIVAEKEARLERMKAELSRTKAPADRYAAMSRLFNEYAAYQYDSAYVYVTQCISLAETMGDQRLLNDSRLGLAQILSAAFLMDKAQMTMNQVDTSLLTLSQRVQYHRALTNMLIYQAEYMQGTQYAEEVISQLIKMRGKITSLDVPHDDVNYLLSIAENYADSKEYDKAIAVLADLLKRFKPGDHMYSIVTSTMSFFYQQEGDKDKQMECLIASAESDLQGCIRENTALRMIADHLFDEGDIDRAYRYMRVAVDDANFYGTRLRNIQSSRIVPKILSAYQTKQDRNRRNMLALVITLSVIALLLVMGVIAIYQLLKRSHRLNKQKNEINDQLQEVNQQLGVTVDQLRDSNAMLQEREQLKEQYIARFLSLSSRFIDRGEEQRKQLYRLYRDHKAEDLARELRSTHFGSENAQLFYENFDNAFLNIYPNFVGEVNKLLQEDGKIETKEGKRLTTESRVLALIRIGITDNQSIANILRASLTTIYTYRSKLRARAISKDDFEESVKKIYSNI